jgi:transposase
MARVDVIIGAERQRYWTEQQKRAINGASLAPGSVVSDVVRRAEVCPGQIYRWRKELRGADRIAEVLIAPAAIVAPAAGGPLGVLL